MISTQNRPSYKFFAKFRSKETQIEDILCEIYLSDNLYGDIKCYIYPNEEQYEIILNQYKFSLEGNITDKSGQIRSSVTIKEAYIKSGNKRVWTKDIVDNIIDIMVFTLEVADFINIETDGKIRIYFWLTPSSYLSPFQSIERSYTGNVNIKNLKNLKIVMCDETNISFEEKYDHLETENNEVKMLSYLVAYCESSKDRFNIEQTYKELKDILLISSFAQRYRCTCVGWEYTTDNISVKHYKRDVSFSTDKKENSLYNILISSEHFEEYLKNAYKNYSLFINKELIRRAIYVISYDNSLPIEDTYKTIFSGLETILLFFQKENNIQSSIIQESDEWIEFKKSINKFIKNKSLLSNDKFKNKRKLVYDKLNELNRSAFNYIFNQFCNFYDIDISDLWPLIDSDNGVSLKKIRDNLVHGKFYDLDIYDALMIASEHLKCIAERMLLNVLGWPVKKSRISKDILKAKSKIYVDWKEYQSMLS